MIQIGGIDVYTNNDWQYSRVKLYTGNAWVNAIPYVYTNGTWTKVGASGVPMIQFVTSDGKDFIVQSNSNFLVRKE